MKEHSGRTVKQKKQKHRNQKFKEIKNLKKPKMTRGKNADRSTLAS